MPSLCWGHCSRTLFAGEEVITHQPPSPAQCSNVYSCVLNTSLCISSVRLAYSCRCHSNFRTGVSRVLYSAGHCTLDFMPAKSLPLTYSPRQGDELFLECPRNARPEDTIKSCYPSYQHAGTHPSPQTCPRCPSNRSLLVQNKCLNFSSHKSIILTRKTSNNWFLPKGKILLL